MMTFGPYFVEPGIVQNVPIPSDTVSLRVTNRSPYDLFLVVSQGQPVPLSQATSAVFEVVGSGDRVTVLLPQSVMQQAFGTIAQNNNTVAGQLWLIANQTDILAQSGLVSRRNAVYVTCFQAGDTPSEASGNPETIDLSSLTKFQRLPLGPNACLSNTLALGTIGTAANLFSSFLNRYPFPNTQTGYIANVYIHAFSAMLRIGSTAEMELKLSVSLYNTSGNTLVSTVDLVFGVCSYNHANVTSTPFVFAPSQPVLASIQQGTVSPGPGQLVFSITPLAGAANMNMIYDLVATVDMTSGVALPDIGTPVSTAAKTPGFGTGIW